VNRKVICVKRFVSDTVQGVVRKTQM